jgi:hypothetical protein
MNLKNIEDSQTVLHQMLLTYYSITPEYTIAQSRGNMGLSTFEEHQIPA